MQDFAIIAEHAVAHPLTSAIGISRLSLLTLGAVACVLVMKRCARKKRDGWSGFALVVALAAIAMAALVFPAASERSAVSSARAEAVRTVGDAEPHQVGIVAQSGVDSVVNVELPDRTSIRAATRQGRHRLREFLRGRHPRLEASLPAIGAVFTLLLIGYAGCRACLGRRINWPIGALVLAAFVALMAAASVLD